MSIRTSVETMICPICGFSGTIPAKLLIPKLKSADLYYCPRCHSIFNVSQSRSVSNAIAQLTLSKSDMITNKTIRAIEEQY